MGATGGAGGDPRPPCPPRLLRGCPGAPLEPSHPRGGWKGDGGGAQHPGAGEGSSLGWRPPEVPSPPLCLSVPSRPCPRLGGGPEGGSAAGHHPQQEQHTRGLEGQTASWAAFTRPDVVPRQGADCGAQAQPSFCDLQPHPAGLWARCPEPRVRPSSSVSLGARPSVSPGGCGSTGHRPV